MPIEPVSFIERTILTNQFRILAMLDEGDAEGYNEKAEIFENGYTGLYSEALQYMNGNEVPYAICNETHEILNMFRILTSSIAALIPAQTAALELNRISFDGFDASNDPHYGFTHFMVTKQGKYTELDPDNLNSHSMSSMMRYKAMLPVYNQLRTGQVRNLTAAELQTLIDAV